jgi:acyl-CoA thioesterase FadM
VVRPEWVDYNGHMSEAYYVLIFGDATDAFYDHRRHGRRGARGGKNIGLHAGSAYPLFDRSA